MKRIRWICRNIEFAKQPYFMDETLNVYRSKSIKEFLSNQDKSWRYWRTIGWRCVKVEVTITII